MSGRPAIDAGKLTRWYDLQAPLYRLWRNDYGSPLLDRVAERLTAGGPASPVLDAGTGTGLLAIGLARRLPGVRIEAVDLSQGMLDVARAEAARQGVAGVRFHRCDVTALPFPAAAFPRVVVAGLFPNLPDPDAALRELARVLAPGGRVLVVEFDREGMGFAARWFMRAMILGYHAVTLLLPRYRFARRWNVRRSTLDRTEFESRAARAGLRTTAAESRYHHWILELEARPAEEP